jgi:pimeloyl-ACP methyl ester carboxylesterase
VRVPVRWYHGDADHIVPFAHGAHVVDLLPDATMDTMAGESHLAGLGRAEEILTGLMSLGSSDRRVVRSLGGQDPPTG